MEKLVEGLFLGLVMSSMVFTTAVLVLYDLWQNAKNNYYTLLQCSLREIAKLKKENEKLKEENNHDKT